MTSSDPPFLLFLVDFGFPIFWWISCFLFLFCFGGFPISLFPLFFEFSILSLVRFCSFHFPQIPIVCDVSRECIPAS